MSIGGGTDQTRSSIWLGGLILLFSICVPDRQIAAQTASPGTERHDATGVRIGRIMLHPTFELGERYDSNIFSDENAPRSDWIITAKPRLTLQGDWRVFHLRLAGGAELGFFKQSTDDSFSDFDLQAQGNLKLGNASIETSLDWRQSHDPRGGNDVPSAAREPVIFDDISARLGGRYASDGLHYETDLTIRRLGFDDSTALNGSVIRNDDRDRTELREILRVLMPLDLGREAYGEASFNQRRYDRTPDDQGRVRDSAGYRLYGGLRLDLTDLITADLAAGWMNQIYSDPGFGDIADYTLRGDMNWAITRLTDVNLLAARTIHETTVTGASGILAFEFGVGVSHELRRWLQIGATAHHSAEEFRQTTRRDQITELGVNLSYALNRYAQIEGTLELDRRSSNSVGNDYERLQSLIRLKLEM